MKTRTLLSGIREWLFPALLSVLILGLFAPVARAQTQPPFSGPPLITDQEQLARATADGRTIYPTFTLGQEFALAFGNTVFPQGGQFGSFSTTTGVFTIVPALFQSPTPALGYATGIGTGQSVTQITNKSTAVTIPNGGSWTGQITMSNASLANGATVKFTVNDAFVWGTDIVIAAPQQGSITAAGAYFVTCNSANGSFVVNVTNQGTTESDAIVLNFVVIRASGN